MKKGCFFLFILVLASHSFAQKKDKIEFSSFCGWKMNDKEKIITFFQPQFEFLKVQENDTIVDIGAQSGSYEGAFLTVNNFKNLSFILVDIDSRCLNQQKVNNMLAHYSKVKGDSIQCHFQLIQNTQDSLWLPLNHYKQVWLMNTLHEIPDQAKMVKEINAILQAGAEIVLLELSPKYEGELHTGCRKPLLSFAQINQLFTSNGFVLKERKNIPRKKNSDVMMMRYIKQ